MIDELLKLITNSFLAEEYWIVVKTTVVGLVLRVSVVRTTFCVLISCVKQQSVYLKKIHNSYMLKHIFTIKQRHAESSYFMPM